MRMDDVSRYGVSVNEGSIGVKNGELGKTLDENEGVDGGG